jgi:hypothetical protein
MKKNLLLVFLIISNTSFSQSFSAGITTDSPVLCGSRTSTILTAFPQGSQYTYAWSYYLGGGSFKNIGTNEPKITASIPGDYWVNITNNLGQTENKYIKITNIPKYNISNFAGNGNIETIVSGDTAKIKITFEGDGSPFSFNYFDGEYFKFVSAISSPHTLKIKPAVNQKISFSSLSSKTCGMAGETFGPNFQLLNYAIVKVDQQPSVNLIDPINSPSACLGGRIAIPFVKNGNWGNEQRVVISLVDNQGNTVQSSSNAEYLVSNTDTLYYNVSQNSSNIGNFKIKVEFSKPFIEAPIISNYFVAIGNSGCSLSSARIFTGGENCTGYFLYAYPYFPGSTYTWKRNGTLYTSGTDNSINPIQTGTYTVQITNTSNNYSSTSPPVILNYSNYVGPSSFVNSACSGSSFLNPLFIYTSNVFQWFYSENELGHEPIPNATSNSYQATKGGSYILQKKSGNCESKIEYNCPILLNFTSQFACSQSNVEIKTNFLFNRSINIQLLNANTNAVVYNGWNFNTTPPNGSPSKTFNITLPPPSIAPYGNYRFRLTSGQIASLPSEGILTIGSPKPILSVSPKYISNNGENVTLKATGCVGDVIWNNGYTGFSQTIFVSNPQTFSATCSQTSSNGCQSLSAAVTVLNNCTFDNYEPNDNKESASQTSTLNFESNPNCLGTGQDKDWFKFINNGQLFYVKVNSSQGNYYPGQYKLKKVITNNVLTLETLPIDLGNSINTEITLFDSSGINQIGYDDNSNPDGFSKIIFNLNSLCQTNINLISPVFDITSNENSIVRGNQIRASIIISNLSISNFRSESSILLNPGFETKLSTAGTFKAEIKNCNNTFP